MVWLDWWLTVNLLDMWLSENGMMNWKSIIWLALPIEIEGIKIGWFNGYNSFGLLGCHRNYSFRTNTDRELINDLLSYHRNDPFRTNADRDVIKDLLSCHRNDPFRTNTDRDVIRDSLSCHGNDPFRTNTYWAVIGIITLEPTLTELS